MQVSRKRLYGRYYWFNTKTVEAKTHKVLNHKATYLTWQKCKLC